jgi:hypothetical protein
MISYLKFKLPEEREEFDLALRAGRAEIVIENLFNWIRQKRKYEDKETVSLEQLHLFLVKECEESELPL